MVGYNKDDKVTMNEKLIAGAISGSVSRVITQPFDVVKVRTQLNKKLENPNRLWFEISRRILREEGIMTFWQGHNLGQLHSVISLSCQFYVFEQSTRWVAKSGLDIKYTSVVNFLCGVLAGCCGAALVVPIEVIRVRQIIHRDQYKGIFKGASEVYKHGGILSFYEGLGASLFQMGPAVGIAFAVFNCVQPRILGLLSNCYICPPTQVYDAKHVMLSSTLAGIASGVISKTATYPFEVAKRRLQIQSHQHQDPHHVGTSTTKDLIKCHSLFECIKEMYREGGFVGMFRGWKVTMWRAQVANVVAFTTYELACFFLRNRHRNSTK